MMSSNSSFLFRIFIVKLISFKLLPMMSSNSSFAIHRANCVQGYFLPKTEQDFLSGNRLNLPQNCWHRRIAEFILSSARASLLCSSLSSSLASYWLLEEMLRLMTDLMRWLMIGSTLQCDDANNFVGDLGGSLK